MSQRKGEAASLLPTVRSGDGSPRQSPGKGVPALLAAQPTSKAAFSLAFASGAVVMLVVALASGAVQWQGVPHGGHLVLRTNSRDGSAAVQAPPGPVVAARKHLEQPDDGGAGGTSLQGHAPDAEVAGPGPQPNLGEDEKRPASAGSAATDEQQQQQQKQQAPQCPPPAREQPCPKPPPCATCPRLPDSPQRAQEAQRKRMPWKPLLSHREVRRGLSYYGSGERLQALVSKLQAGRPIKAYTLGGSVTKGQGASDPEKGYPARFFDFINATWPHRDHVLVNKGIGGTSSGVYAACAEQMVGEDPDLIIVEFTVNERPNEPYTSAHRRGYEQLLRKLLRLPGPPAVIQMHHYAWWRAIGDGVDRGLYYYPQAEAQLTVFSTYYDVPSVSLRAATYELMQGSAPGFKTEKVWDAGKKTTTGIELEQAGKKERDLYFYNDRTHPNDRGHQVIAELLASLVLKATAEFSEGWERAVGAAAGWAADRPQSDMQAEDGDAGPSQLPPPMIPGNADVPTSLCAIQEGFKDVVVAHDGFEYKPDRPEEATFVGQKWGWSGAKPGDWAELEFDSREHQLPGQAAPADDAPGEHKMAEVYLTHLKGYEGFGTAAMECVSGCVCSAKGRVLDGTWKQKATLMQIHRFQVSQHKRCRVRVTVRKEPGAVRQQGHKVTLTAVMVSHFPIRLKTYESQPEQVANLV